MTHPLISKLPHREPFVFVDAVEGITANTADVSWTVSGSEDFFRGHFEGDTIVPGVLLIESMAQAAGLVLIARDLDRAHVGLLVQSDIRFRAPVRPPATIAIHALEDGCVGSLHSFAVTARCQSQIVADGTLVLAVARPAISE